MKEIKKDKKNKTTKKILKKSPKSNLYPIYINWPKQTKKLCKLRKVNLEDDLEKAIINKGLFLVYQPLFELKTKKMIGMEVLLRWKHPKYGLIPIEKVIDLAEKTGLIHDIGEWILDTAISQYRTWVHMGYIGYYISINISAIQLDNKELVSFIRGLLQYQDVVTNNLILEITESAIIKQRKIAQRAIKYLYKAGIKISIDDFGTGYSALNRITCLPIYLLKIDKTFIQNIGNKSDEIIIKAIISLARSLNIKILAEGVETEKQREFLLKNGCANAQGYYFSRPLSADKMTKFLKKHHNYTNKVMT